MEVTEMTLRFLFLLISLLNVSICAAQQSSKLNQRLQEDGCALTVNVSGTKNSQRTLIIFLFDHSKVFTSEAEATISKATFKIEAGKVSYVFNGLKPGKYYAVSVMHDENANGVMDSNLIGIPKEGYATSNNIPHSMFGPPKFDAAKMQLSDSSTIQIKMLY
ncbi:MAG: DUF2141 domain-containing protein [Pirellulaceae bacterium]